MRLQVDVIGVFRFLALVPDSMTIQNLSQHLTAEFQSTYELQISPRLVRIQTDTLQDLPIDSLVSEQFTEMSRVCAVPEQTWQDQLKRAPWTVVGIDEQEFEIRLELLRRVYGEECNPSVLRSCLVRAGGALSRAVAVASYIRPDVLGSSKKVVFVRPKIEK